LKHLHPAKVAVLDIEASGFGRQSYPIELGYVLPNGRAQCWLLQPAPHWLHWDVAAQALHGLSRQTLLTTGRPLHEVAAALNADLQGLTVYCDGWAHDYTWLGALFDAADSAPSFKLESVHALLQGPELALLDQAREEAHALLRLRRHRASSDARALQMALLRVMAGRQPIAGCRLAIAECNLGT
jgi:hypothetical protein